MKVLIDRFRRLLNGGCWVLALASGAVLAAEEPYVLVLGVAQDGGRPQAGSRREELFEPAARRLVASLALVDPGGPERPARRFLLEATPDLREQLRDLDVAAPVAASPGLDGIFLTHAHMGHYTGLLFLGHESMGARQVPVWAMPRMGAFLRENGPWSQLVEYRNIAVRALHESERVELGAGLAVTPFRVPHREEFSEVVGFLVDGPSRSVAFLPDIDSWEAWDESGIGLEALLQRVDVAYLDATFWDDREIPGRDMSGFPHPRILETMDRVEESSPGSIGKVRFIHLNHTNPANEVDSKERREIEKRGFRVAVRGERVLLGRSPDTE